MPVACFSQKEIKYSLTRGPQAPLIGRFKGWVQGGGNRNPPPCPFFPPTFFGKKVGPPEAGAFMGRADTIRPYGLSVRPSR